MNLPERVRDALNGNVLFVGIGGGYDIMGAVPLYMTFEDKCTFANYNGSKLKTLEKFTTESQPLEDAYIESRLAQYLAPHNLNQNVYAIPRGGVQSIKVNLDQIIQENDIDAIVAVDGGVDSLMTGDEEGAGTWLDDTAALTAVRLVDRRVPKVLACLGFGTELEEELCHHHVLQNMAELMSIEAFYGSCALLRDSFEFREYQEACEHVWEGRRKSHIHTKVISAVNGMFGDVNQYDGVDAQVVGGVKCKNFVSPLMSLYWFFELNAVVSRNKIAKAIEKTNTSTDVLMVYRQMIGQLVNKRPREVIPY